MADPKADCGGVDRRLAVRVAAFADELLAFADQVYSQLPVRRVLSMPGSAISVAYSDPAYARLCDKSFLSSACVGSELSPPRLAVFDHSYSSRVPQWRFASPGLGNVTRALAEKGICGAFDPDFGIWKIYHPQHALAVQLMDSATRYPPWEESFPLRLLVHWIGQGPGRGMIHAGTLGHDGVGVFLAGAGGAGKSGTSLSGILNGLKSVGDDYVGVNCTAASVEAHPVLRLMKQDPDGLERLGIAETRGVFNRPNWQGKYEFDFDQLVPGARATRLAMTAILLPRISRAPRSSIRRTSGRRAMMALAPSSLYQLHGNWAADFKVIASVARALPAYELELSSSPTEICHTIRSFIEERAA